MAAVWILGDCSADDEARLRSFVEGALRELDTDVTLPLHLAAEPRADLRPWTLGWVGAAGAHIVVATLELGDQALRHLVYHEVAHWFAMQEYPELRPILARAIRRLVRGPLGADRVGGAHGTRQL
jgi:hypothetical protein